MANVDLQKNPVEGFSAGLVGDNIYEVTSLQNKLALICFFVLFTFETIA